MAYTLTRLRANIYKIVDEVLETGVAAEIVRGNHRLRLVPEQRAGRLSRLKPHPQFIMGDSDDLVHLDWSKEWKP
jgi:hypothetical protein